MCVFVCILFEAPFFKGQIHPIITLNLCLWCISQCSALLTVLSILLMLFGSVSSSGRVRISCGVSTKPFNIFFFSHLSHTETEQICYYFSLSRICTGSYNQNLKLCFTHITTVIVDWTLRASKTVPEHLRTEESVAHTNASVWTHYSYSKLTTWHWQSAYCFQEDMCPAARSNLHVQTYKFI